MGRGKERWGGSEGVRGEGEGERRGREERERGEGEMGERRDREGILPWEEITRRLGSPGPPSCPLVHIPMALGGGPTLTPPGHTSLATTATDLLLVGARLPSNVQPGCLLPKQS
jgi:hypothetical protein